MNKFNLLAISLLVIMAFTFSCSNGDDNDDNGGNNNNTVINNVITKTYNLEKGQGYFEYYNKYEDWSCAKGGILYKDSTREGDEIDYSIDNNIMIWENYGDTIQFSGNSNELSGTWTRTRNSEAPCEMKNDEYDGPYYDCKAYWQVTKLEFTETTVTITNDYCLAEEMVGIFTLPNAETKIIDCNNIEVSKGSEKFTVKIIPTSEDIVFTYIYKDKSCSFNEKLSKAEYESICKKYWDKYGEYGYNGYWYEYDFKNEDIRECAEILPKNVFGNEEENEEATLKALAKKTFMPSNNRKHPLFFR